MGMLHRRNFFSTALVCKSARKSKVLNASSTSLENSSLTRPIRTSKAESKALTSVPILSNGNYAQLYERDKHCDFKKSIAIITCPLPTQETSPISKMTSSRIIPRSTTLSLNAPSSPDDSRTPSLRTLHISSNGLSVASSIKPQNKRPSSAIRSSSANPNARASAVAVTKEKSNSKGGTSPGSSKACVAINKTAGSIITVKAAPSHRVPEKLPDLFTPLHFPTMKTIRPYSPWVDHGLKTSSFYAKSRPPCVSFGKATSTSQKKQASVSRQPDTFSHSTSPELLHPCKLARPSVVRQHALTAQYHSPGKSSLLVEKANSAKMALLCPEFHEGLKPMNSVPALPTSATRTTASADVHSLANSASSGNTSMLHPKNIPKTSSVTIRPVMPALSPTREQCHELARSGGMELHTVNHKPKSKNRSKRVGRKKEQKLSFVHK